MGKTKRDQLQSWNIPSFDPQKIEVDEHINLLNTLGNMLDQKDEAKMEKFVDTMPTIIQTHLVLVKIGQRLPRNENNQSILLENVAALPTLTQDTAVPSL